MSNNFELYLILSVLVTLPSLFLQTKEKVRRILDLLSISSVLILCGVLTFHGEVESGNVLYLFGKNVLVVQTLGSLIFMHNVRSFIMNKLSRIQPFVSNILFCGIFVIFSSLDVLVLYFSFSILTICTLFYSSKKHLSSMLSLFFQSIIIELTLIIGILFFIAATGGINIININVINHEFMALSFIFLFGYTLFKLAVFPFHSWLPIVTANAKDRSLILFGVILSSYALLMIPLLQKILVELEPQYQTTFSTIIKIIVILSTIYGLLMAWKQDKIEKSFSYFSLVPIALIILSINLEPSEDLFLQQLYYIVFTFVTLGMSHVLISELSNKNEKTNSSNLIDSYSLAKFKSIFLIILLLSLFGMPLTVGFSIKSAIILKYIDAGYIREMIIILISSILGFVIIFDYIGQLFQKNENTYPREIIGNYFPAQLIEFVIILSVIIGGVIPTIL